MLTVSKGVLKAKMLEYFRTVERTGKPLIVTDHRRPVLRIEPIRKGQTADALFHDLRGHGSCSEKDLLAPESDAWGELS